MREGGKTVIKQKSQAGIVADRKYIINNKISSKKINRFHQVLEKLPNAIYTCDVRGRITFFNRAAAKLWGREPELNKDLWCGSWKIYKSDGSYIPADASPMAKTLKEIYEFINEEIIIEQPNGERRHVVTHPQLIYNSSGIVVGALNSLIDITIQQSLKKKNIALEQFSYSASHDLQEPLRKIHIFSELIEENIDDIKSVKSNLNKIKSSALRMTTLVRNILQYSLLSVEEEHFVVTDINKIIQNIETDYELLISQKKAVIKYSKLPFIKGIPVQLYQLFANLISNSLKYNYKNPLIEISATIITNEEAKRHLSITDKRKFIKFIVKDNGIGFEPGNAEKIFNLFHRLNDDAQYNGTGIGLALCRKIAENHNGYIHAETETGKWTIFNIYFPS